MLPPQPSTANASRAREQPTSISQFGTSGAPSNAWRYVNELGLVTTSIHLSTYTKKIVLFLVLPILAEKPQRARKQREPVQQTEHNNQQEALEDVLIRRRLARG